MKRFAFILTSLLLVLSFGLANGQSISIDPIAELVGGNLPTGKDITIPIRFSQNHTVKVTGLTNGFQLYSLDGATWTYPEPLANCHTGAVTAAMFDGGVFINEFSTDGALEDTVGFGGFAMFGTGIPVGFDEVVMEIHVQFDHSMDGLHFGVDSSYYPPGGAWAWASPAGEIQPDFVGEEWMIYFVPDQIPEFVNPGVCPLAIGDFGHCDVVSFDFDANDPDTDPHDVVYYDMSAGPGAVDNGTGVWSYSPSQADVGAFSVTVRAYELDGPEAFCEITGNFTNIGPSFVDCAGTPLVPVGKGNTATNGAVATDGDCDPISYSIVGVTPVPNGTYSIDPNTGVITFNTLEADAATNDTQYDFTVEVSDGLATDQCVVSFDVLATEPFQVRIEKTHLAIQGTHETVDITLEKGSEPLGGFDFLIAYDASALTFVGALEGELLTECGWEYFTYRYGATGNCDGGCPSGMLRVVAIAETNNGANHPTCFALEDEYTLAVLDFLVTDDRTLECQYVPVRFFWFDCGDNTISSMTGDSLFISRYVYDFDLIGEITGVADYPTFTGAQDVDCFVGDANKIPIRFIDFFNGGVDIACADELDARGDVNLNEIGYEIADAVLFSNYFVYGLSVFWNIPGQQAATDVNADGLSLSVADLVYLIRVVVGDALPYPKLNPESATYAVDNGTLRVSSEMGAASVIVEGNTVPTLLADNMEMRYNFDGTNTRVLVYSMEEGAKFAGDFLNVNGNVVSIEMATYEGTPVAAKEIPANYSLKQNYPNPFNPKTVMAFDMAKAGNYDLTVYNVAGQQVSQFSGQAEAGTVNVEWDASNMASGIYFYKLNTNNFSDTKKMVLLK
ncbi:MAG: hypothetical protein DRP35_04695 [Candidatus Zixiibacteriota bacterium]|nr:MAG: hypothetical protein DRP35_04695 [candidate division Zixibacteria bacterium]